MKHKQPDKQQQQSGQKSGNQQPQKSDGSRQAGIGSSQGQDRGSSDMNESQNTQHGSLVNESTGAFKERP